MIEPMEETGDLENMENILEIVKAGGEGLLTEGEFQQYSDYTDEVMGSTDTNDHNANLAEAVNVADESYLNMLASDVEEWVDTDLSSRDDWLKKEVRGIRLLGTSMNTVGGGKFEGASRVTHPLLMEACTQFQARAIAEMWPPEGPVKAAVIGEPTDETLSQSYRVAEYMNYQYTTKMPGAFEEEDKMLFRLPISGSCFKKTVYDPLEGELVSKFIESSVMIVPYAASSLRTAIRYTEQFEESVNDTNKKIAAGVYRSVDLQGTQDYGDNDHTIVQDEIDDNEGESFVQYEGDHPFTRFECYCLLDLPGFEDVDENGEETGIALPYVVTVDKDSQEVLAIRRNWRESDAKKRRRVLYTHFRFLPGLGFYGFGLVHAIGGLSESATGALRALLDAAGLANTKGGYRSRDAKVKGGEVPIGMGEWREVDSTADELSSAFYAMPYDEPSPTLFNLLGMLDDLGRRFASTTENMVGDGDNSGPVGTTLALIEQGSKVYSAIHLRLHHAHGEEFSLLAELNSEFLVEEYPYAVPGKNSFILKMDFDDRVDVKPVSDPNTISDTQRISRAQGVMQLSEANPDLYDKRVVNRNMLTAMRVPNIEEVMPPPEEVPPMDPVTEMANIMMGEPVQAFNEQDHQAHLEVHEAIWTTWNEDDQELHAGQYMAHIAEHKAMDMILAFEELLGAPITPENQAIATQASAQVAQIYVDEVGRGDSEESRKLDAQETEEERRNIEAMAKVKRDDFESAAKVQREDDAANAEIERQAQNEMIKTLGEASNALGIDNEEQT